ncbi:MAG: hypothetical protein GC191_11165 [Azospirillum sp.]|nr:hypothetical protein [Azospirillum sp.]
MLITLFGTPKTDSAAANRTVNAVTGRPAVASTTTHQPVAATTHHEPVASTTRHLPVVTVMSEQSGKPTRAERRGRDVPVPARRRQAMESAVSGKSKAKAQVKISQAGKNATASRWPKEFAVPFAIQNRRSAEPPPDLW